MKRTWVVVLGVIGLVSAGSLRLSAESEGPARKGCELEPTEVRLEATLAKVRLERAADALFLRRLKRSQQAWHTYRDTQLEALFPTPRKLNQSAATRVLLLSGRRGAEECREAEALTRRRIEELDRWTSAEGDGR